MASRVEKNVAYSIFKLAKQGGYIPGNVLAAAGRVVRGKANAHDMEAIREFKGISHSGATASKQALRDFSRPLGQVGHMSVLAGEMMRGGATGAGASLAFAQRAASLADGLARSPVFRELLTRVMSGPQVGQEIEGQLRKALRSQTLAAGRAIVGLARRAPDTAARMLTGGTRGAAASALTQLPGESKGQFYDRMRNAVNAQRARDEAASLAARGWWQSRGAEDPDSVIANILEARESDWARADLARMKGMLGSSSLIAARRRQLRGLGVRTRAQEQELATLTTTAKAITAQQVGGTGLAYALGRAAQVARASIGFIAAGAAVTKGIVALGSAAGGDWTEQTRLARSQARLLAAQPEQWRAARLAQDKLSLQEQARRALMHPGRYFGLRGQGALLEQRTTAEQMHALGLTGKYDVEKLRQYAWKERTNDTFLGRVWGGLKSAAEWVSPSLYAKEKTEAARTKMERAVGLRGQGYEAAVIGNVGTAQAFFEEAGKELKDVGRWEMWNSAAVYREALGGQEADHWWARSQMKKAGARTGD